MSERYVLHWRAPTGATGHGNPIEGRAVAQAWLDYANDKFPDLTHWLELIVTPAGVRAADA